MDSPDPQAALDCGRRANPRLRLLMPVELVTLDGEGPAVLESLSATGARISSRFVLRQGASCILRLPGMELFADVAWCAQGRSALIFERPLSQAQLLVMRALDARAKPTEREASMNWARAFVDGTTGTRR